MDDQKRWALVPTRTGVAGAIALYDDWRERLHAAPHGSEAEDAVFQEVSEKFWFHCWPTTQGQRQ